MWITSKCEQESKVKVLAGWNVDSIFYDFELWLAVLSHLSILVL